MQHLLEHFKDLTLNPKNAKELKGLILQLAVEGKLTRRWRKENPKVEPASVLLKKIAAEKAQLFNDKKLKREEVLPEIEQGEIEFDLAENWEYCRLGEVIEIIRGITFPSSEKTKDDSPGKIPCLRTANVQDKIEWEDLLYIDRKFVKRDDQILRKGDVIMSMANSRELVGKVAIIDFEPSRDFTLGGFISALRTFGFDHSFLMVLLRSPKTRNELISSSSQTTNIANVSIAKLRPLVIPFPPLEEQKAIVATVNQLFAEVELLEVATKKRIQLKEDFVSSALRRLSTEDTASAWGYLLHHFKTFFTEKSSIKKLRESILQLAVQGKLTRDFRKSHPELCEGTHSAEALLESIKDEKAKLIKEGKIKKEKPLPTITADEIPYELPKGWVWCRLGDVIKEKPRNGFSPNGVDYITNTKSLKLGATTKGYFNSKEVKYLDVEIPLDSFLWLRPNDILIQRSNSIDYVGVSAIYNGAENEFVYPDLMMKIQVTEPISTNYLHTVLSSQLVRAYFREKASGTSGNMPKINQGIVLNTLVPFTSELEQKAIVQKVNALMTLCDRLEKEIETQKMTQEEWMQSCLREVFEGKKNEVIIKC